MRIILHNRSLYIFGAIALIGIALWLLFSLVGSKNVAYVTTVAERGDVVEIVSVSGVVEAENTAELAFPIGGIVSSVQVTEGDTVVAGDTLVTLQQASLAADRRDAVAALLTTQADRDELINGPSDETRAVTATEVAIAKESLARTIAEENQKITNAERALVSGGLQALPVDEEEAVAAPIVSGSYNCKAEGEYTLDVFSSASNSGYSFRLGGLESGLYPAAVNQASPFGDCGLKLQFGATGNYNDSEWTIAVPNTQSTAYTANLNVLDLAKEQAQNAIESAEQALDLALKQQLLENADPRDEALRRANAAVMQAEARLAAVDANIADRTITAPFDGVITDIDVLPGETVSSVPVVTLLADNVFELTARIPEIDITKITPGQATNVVFDAQANSAIVGTVGFISPLAIEIDGVAYFETTIQFPEVPAWLRSGLNADIDIVVAEATDVVRVPKRFVTTNADQAFVLRYDESLPPAKRVEEHPITVSFTGNDGYVAIDGIEAGTAIAAP